MMISVKMTLAIPQLPSELWARIASFSDRKSLKNLRLTGHRCSKSATRELFREVRLTVGDPSCVRLEQVRAHEELKQYVNKINLGLRDGPFPISSSQQIWSSTESLIDWNLPTPGRRLYSIMKDIEARLTIDFIASRFSLVYATFEVDHSDYGKRKSRAFKMVAKDWGCDVKQVKQVEKRGKNYISLMRDNLAIIRIEARSFWNLRIPANKSTAASDRSLAPTTVSQ
ncbi:hypothetical protein I7I51_00665 [Histoplasma capsulatum]|uniref:F-box domain-containing protein n=1 Tax=Ajellomyces capsulatus TaxID=5037 RepID=A0A8A1MAS4_AJECA|nr:hypothetical protein I7I51_00665 [Histoplasma capsulatum]